MFTLVDIFTDISFAVQYLAISRSHIVKRLNGRYGYYRGEYFDSQSLDIYAIFTTVWIALGLGGLAQFSLVANFLVGCRLNKLPNSIRCILLLCSLFLLGPVVINVFGAIFVIRNADEVGIWDDVQRFDFFSF